jgi:organic hydroperoxide reductase OsmC/OhrA
MQAYPHHYTVSAEARAQGSVELSSGELPSLTTAAPPQYDGPGGQWSPETLLVAAVADCFVLTFRAIADASRLRWSDVQCRAAGSIDRVGGPVQLAQLHLDARLTLPAGSDPARARHLLEKAEKACLVTNSLKIEPTLTLDVSESAAE